MKHFFRNYEKFFTLHFYIVFLKRQPEHMRHIYAILFSGIITLFLGAIILYFDYGFWHERYSRQEAIETENLTTNEDQITVQSPTEMMGSFFQEASEKFHAITDATSSIFGGEETYVKEEEDTSSSQ